MGRVSRAASSRPTKVLGLLAPHAGYRYSGEVAAHAYSALAPEGHPIVVVLAPFHAFHEAPLLVSSHDGYQTPLGPVPIDKEMIARLNTALLAHNGHGLTPISGDVEHAVEIQLPFLQHVLGEFPLVPIMLAHQNPRTVADLAESLMEVLGDKETLLIASSDLSHYYPQHLAVLLDREMLRRVERLDPEAVMVAESDGVGYACGKGAIAAMLLVARASGAEHVDVLSYRTSGDVTGDFDSVVGYAAATVW